MRQITWDRDIPFIKNFAVGGFHTLEYVNVSVCLCIVLASWIERTRAERNPLAQDR
jgi:hypothetical protein